MGFGFGLGFGLGLGLEVREGDLAALVRVELLEGLLDRALLGHAALRLGVGVGVGVGLG